MIPDKIPSALRERPQWIVWGDGRRKIPFRAGTQEEASSTDSGTWSTFEDAAAGVGDHCGVGYVFSADDPFCGVDLDGCRDPATGEFASWARDWIGRFDSYTEVSPSGTGVKIWVRGKNPADSGKNRKIDEERISDKDPGVEMYDAKRYFAVTSWRIGGVSAEIERRQDVLDAFAAEFFRPVALPSFAPAETSVADRARTYLRRLPPAISGQGGHNQTFRAACVLVLGFGLSESESLAVLSEYNERCEPAWSERELRHKVQDAAKQLGPRNYLRDVPLERQASVAIPEYKAPEPKTDAATLQEAAAMYLEQLKAGNADLIDLGIADLDYAVGGGVARGEMVIIAARPSHGKSAVALQCLDTASRAGIPGLIVSEEMSQAAIGKRAIQFASDTPEEHWRSRSTEVEQELDHHFDQRAPVYVIENCRTSTKAAETIRWYVENKDIGVAVVDYAQLLSSKGGTRYEQITETSITLRKLANETNVVLIVLCQLSRSIEDRPKFQPRNSDLKDSGQLEQDADVVVFLVWPHRIDAANPPDEMQMFVAKNRNRAINSAAFTARFLPSRQMVLAKMPEVPEVEPIDEFEKWNEGSTPRSATAAGATGAGD